MTLAETLDAFEQAFATLDYQKCATGDPEPGWEKVAFYQKNGVISHAAKQLPSGRWMSKLGMNIDIEHHSLTALEDVHGQGAYGEVVGFMRRVV